jgi:hypothetical protein
MSLVCNDLETKVESKWWQLTFTKSDQSTVTKGYRHATKALRKAEQLFRQGRDYKLEPALTDIYIVDQDSGDLILVESKYDPIEAARFAKLYSGTDRGRGCLLWPHGVPTPKGWKVFDAPNETAHSVEEVA